MVFDHGTAGRRIGYWRLLATHCLEKFAIWKFAIWKFAICELRNSSFRDSYGWHHGVTFHTRQFPPNYRIRDFPCHAMWASEHRGLRCWFFRGVLLHFSAGSIYFARDCFLCHWLLSALPVVDPPVVHIFSRHTRPPRRCPTDPRVTTSVGTLCVCHSSCCSGAPPPPPQKTDVQYHVPPGCATICLLGIYTMCERSPPHVWCPHDDAVVVHTTRWRGSKSTPVISILQNKSLTLFLVRTFCRIRGLYGLQD